MSKPLRFHSAALEKLTAEAVYDEAKSSGLGARKPGYWRDRMSNG